MDGNPKSSELFRQFQAALKCIRPNGQNVLLLLKQRQRRWIIFKTLKPVWINREITFFVGHNEGSMMLLLVIRNTYHLALVHLH
ncbi:unnamed protein product [Lathyrus oleraceus]